MLRVTEGEQKVKCVWMHSFTGAALLSTAWQKASRSVGLLTGSFLPRLRQPSDQPSFASQFMNFTATEKQADDGLRGR